MYRHGEQVKKEIEEYLTDGKGCVVFDFSCYFPYANQEDLLFDFQLGEEKFIDIKKNHRYPNHNYVTLSKKTGRKVSKIGYPYFFDIAKEEQIFLLDIKIGLKEEHFELVIPVQTTLTKERPVCALELKFDFDTCNFTFTTHESCEDGSWLPITWTNNADNKCFTYCAERTFLMDTPKNVGKDILLYGLVITPVAGIIDTILI